MKIRKRQGPAPRHETCLRVTGDALIAGACERPLPADATPEDVLGHYLEFIRTLRNADHLDDVPIRDDDVDALAEALGGTPAEIERRLVELIDCTKRQARAIRKALFRRRLAVPAAGFMFSVSGLGAAVTLKDAEPPVVAEAEPQVLDISGGYVRPDSPEPPAVEAPAPAAEDDAITRSGTGVGGDWAEIIDPMVITPEDGGTGG